MKSNMSGLTKQVIVLATIRKQNKELRMQLASTKAEIELLKKRFLLSDAIKDGFRDIAIDSAAKAA
jgi:hypothetical protein